jgi:hypothetical protein
MTFRTWLTVLAASASAAFAGGAAAKDVLLPEDFAYAWPLTLGGGDFHRVILPAEVYAVVRAPDLADVRVLDARGRPVPRFVHVPEPQDGEARRELSVPVFVVGVNQSDADVVARVSVETAAPGASATTSVRVITDGTGLTGPGHWIAVLDEPVEHVRALRLGWHPLAESFVAHVLIETSDDLETWRTVGNGSIAAFVFDGSQIVRDSATLHGNPLRYLRITPRDVPENFRLDALRLQFAPPRGEPVRAWHSTPLPADGSALEIDLGAAVPVDRIDVAPSANAGLVHAELHARATPRDSWRLVDQAVFYRLDRTREGLASTPAEISRTIARYWKLELSGSPAFAGEVRLGWRPAEVMFLAQGEPPFRLFAGSARHAKVSPELVRLDEGLRSLWRDRRLQDAAPATLGERETVSGEDAYSIQTREAWRVWVLWALLVSGVALVAWMAWRVARGLRRTDAEPSG